MDRKSYENLNTAEKMVVGYIYDLYIKWAQERLDTNYLKNSIFCDFVGMLKLDDELKYYAHYFYLLSYKAENEIKDVERGYGYIVPESKLTVAKELVENKLNNYKKQK